MQVERELSMSLWIRIFHRLHKLAKDFELKVQQESFVVYNVSVVVVVELSMQNPIQEFPEYQQRNETRKKN